MIELRSPQPLEYRVVWPDGTVRTVFAEADELAFDDEGRPALMSGIVQDLTEQKRVESELRRSVDELDLSRRALLSLVEDQKRAEAEVRRLNAELEQRVLDRTAQLEDGEPGTRRVRLFRVPRPAGAAARRRRLRADPAGGLRHHARRRGPAPLRRHQRQRADMGRLIDNLLSPSPASAAPTMHPSRVDMAPRWSQAVFDRLATPTTGRASTSTWPPAGAVGDPALIRQVWMNLLSNAVKFSAKQEQAVIEVSADRREGRGRVLRSGDNGAGFDMQYADKLFGVFQRLHSAEGVRGHGRRPGHRPAHRPAPRRPGLGRGPVKRRGDLFLYVRAGSGSLTVDDDACVEIVVVEDNPRDAELAVRALPEARHHQARCASCRTGSKRSTSCSPGAPMPAGRPHRLQR